MKFKVRAVSNQADTVDVGYDCPCGCKPGAKYQRGAGAAGHEHCCCGRVHFVGPQAERELESYLEERRRSGEDAGLEYTISTQQVKSRWGERIPVAFAVPARSGDGHT